MLHENVQVIVTKTVYLEMGKKFKQMFKEHFVSFPPVDQQDVTVCYHILQV